MWTMKVSVIIPLYNKAEWVKRAIDSVLSQTFQDFEIVIVDDGSTDGGDKIVEKINDARIKFIRQHNAGAAAARNTGITNSKGQWIAFLDADDVWLPDNLMSHIGLLKKHPTIEWSTGFSNRRLSDGTLNEVSFKKNSRQLFRGGVIADSFIFVCNGGGLDTDGVMIRKKIFDRVGLMDTNLKTAEDVDMWLRIALEYPRLAHLNKAVAEYYIDTAGSLIKSQNYSYSDYPLLNFLNKHIGLLKKVEGQRYKSLMRLFNEFIHTTIMTFRLNNRRNLIRKVLVDYSDIISHKKKCLYFILSITPFGTVNTSLKLKKIFYSFFR